MQQTNNIIVILESNKLRHKFIIPLKLSTATSVSMIPTTCIECYYYYCHCVGHDVGNLFIFAIDTNNKTNWSHKTTPTLAELITLQSSCEKFPLH